ncbi:MAG: hypothetical protein ACUVTZ_14405 [Armatimonadota bacterium]
MAVSPACEGTKAGWRALCQTAVGAGVMGQDFRFRGHDEGDARMAVKGVEDEGVGDERANRGNEPGCGTLGHADGMILCDRDIIHKYTDGDIGMSFDAPSSPC